MMKDSGSCQIKSHSLILLLIHLLTWEFCLFSLCQPDLDKMGFQSLGFLTYLDDRLVWFATGDDVIEEWYLNVYISGACN